MVQIGTVHGISFGKIDYIFANESVIYVLLDWF